MKIRINKSSEFEIGIEKLRARFYIYFGLFEIAFTRIKWLRKYPDFWALYSKNLKGIDFEKLDK